MEPIQTCKRCLYPASHPLGITMDTEGICSGCRIHEEKDNLDWNGRWKKLLDIVRPYRSLSEENYDCIVPVTGGGDSYFILHLVKEKLGLNPLLVTYNKYFNTPLGIWNLANLRTRFNCDILIQNVNPNSVKKITRSTLRQFGSIYWPCLAGQTVFPVQTAVRYEVPLIIWGANQGLEQVGMFSHEHEVEMTRRYRKDHDLMGFEADDLLSIFDTLTDNDIWQYRYPADNDLRRVGVRGIYLGNYVRWDPKAQHEEMIKRYKYRTTRFSRTFDCYDHVDCFNFMDIHDQLKLYKHGFSKVTDHASREIRHGRITRDEGLAFVKHFEHMPLKYSENFCDWLEVNIRGLNLIMDQHRNQRFWKQTEPGVWDFSKVEPSKVSIDIKDAFNESPFLANSHLLDSNQSKYITIGKGWP